MAIEHVVIHGAESALPGLPTFHEEAASRLMERQMAHRTALGRFEECHTVLLEAARLLTETLRRGQTVLTAGNGGSAAEAQHFAAELVGRFRLERRAYPVLALTTDSSTVTAIANDYGYRDVFSRQVEAFARPGDLLIAYSTSGDSENVCQAAFVARKCGASVLAMTGEGQCRLDECADVVVHAPSTDTPTVQELHTIFTHVLCDISESILAGLDGRSPA